MNQFVDNTSPQSAPVSTFDKVWSTLETLSSVGEVAFLRGSGKWTPFQIAALSMRLVSAGITIDRTWRRRDPQTDIQACRDWLDTQTTKDDPLVALDLVMGTSLFAGASVKDAMAQGKTVYQRGTYEVKLLGGSIPMWAWEHSPDGFGWGTVYVKTSQREAVQAASRVKLWQGVRVLKLSSGLRPLPEHNITLPIWARQTAERIQAFQDGQPRSFLINGEPGTGKSWAAQAIAQSVGRTLVISAEDLRATSSVTVPLSDTFDVEFDRMRLIRFLRPDCVVVNDIDRLKNPTTVLDFLDEVRGVCKLILITSNFASGMGSAEGRVERIDDIIEVCPLTREELHALLGDAAHAFTVPQIAEMETWPLAYVKDAARRVRCLGADYATTEFNILKARRNDAHAKWQTEGANSSPVPNNNEVVSHPRDW